MIDISRLNSSELDRFLHLQSIVDRQLDAQARVRALRAYYGGDHPVLLTQRQQEYLGSLVTEGNFPFAHNLVRTVIDTLRERLSVVGFTVNGVGAEEGDDATPEGLAAAALWRWWGANRLDSQQIRLYRRALRDGLSYTVVDFDNEAGIPRVNLQKVDDGVTGITLHRDPTDTNRILFVNRYFYTYDPLTPGETGKERKTTYLPGQIRKYIRSGAGLWEPYAVEDSGMWPLLWEDMRRRPLGVAGVEFANPGGSEVLQIIGLQNALNKSWLDLIAAADASGFPVFVAEYDGQDAPLVSDDDDLEGDDEMRIAPGRAWEIFGGRVHSIPPANLTPMMDTVWGIVAAIAGVSRTPQYYLRPIGGADVPSGEALKQLESGLVRRAEERQLVFGQAWADVMTLCYRVSQMYGSEQLPDLPKMDVGVQWRDPEVRNDATQANVARAHKDLGVPDAQVWQLLGYEPEEIATFERTARAAQAAQVAAIAGALRQQAQNMQPTPATQAATRAVQFTQNGDNNG